MPIEALKRLAQQNTTTAKENDKVESNIEELENLIVGYVLSLTEKLMNPDHSTTTHMINYKDLRTEVIKVADSLPESDNKVPQELAKEIINGWDPYFKRNDYNGAVQVAARKHQYGTSLQLTDPIKDLKFTLDINPTNPQLVSLFEHEYDRAESPSSLQSAGKSFHSEDVLPMDKGIAMGIFTQAVSEVVARK